MRLITRNTDYAIRALCFIAENNKKEIISVSELVKNLKIPRPFLRKLLQILNKKGLLRSYKGKGGGFELAMLPEKIFLVDLIEIFQGPLNLDECIFKRRSCPDIKSCLLREKIEAIKDYVSEELKSITIKSLINSEV